MKWVWKWRGRQISQRSDLFLQIMSSTSTAPMTACRRLGLELKVDKSKGLRPSQILKVLGPGWFAEFPVVRTTGKVVWCNFELARQLGFQIPRTNDANSEFQAHLVSTLSLRSTVNGARQTNERVTIFADKYGGDGVSPALGAGRAGFMPYGNLYVKGLGLTPLFKHDDPDDFAHSHGEVHMDDCLSEAIFGEVNDNLFTHGSARVLAIIDQGRSVTAPSGQVIKVCLLVRAGTQLRPGHLVGNHLSRGRSRLENFLRMTRSNGQLVTRRDPKTRRRLPDVRATMLRIINDHAMTAAESFRWRMIHGAVTPSNMDLSGAMLDVPTQSAQPRTASICSISWGKSIFGVEHKERAAALVPMYRALRSQTAVEARIRFNAGWINIAAEMDKAYRRHLEVKLLCAIGLKTKVAECIQDEQKDLTSGFADLILRMAALKNPGSTQTWKSTVQAVSVLDVFHLLQHFPETYFEAPEANHTRKIRAYLKPIFKGSHTQIVTKKRVVAILIREFADLFPTIMKAAAAHVPQYYQDLPSMQTSIRARAAFENKPIAALYAKSMSRELGRLIRDYRQSGNPESIRLTLNERITASLRSVDRLLSQGTRERLSRGLELERQTIDGISYAVRAWNDPAQTRRLQVSIPVERHGDQYLSAVPTLPRLTRREVEALRLRFSTDGRKNWKEVTGQLRRGRNQLMIDFEEIRSFPLIGRLNAIPYLPRSNRFDRRGQNRLGGYVFAIPDANELADLIA